MIKASYGPKYMSDETYERLLNVFRYIKLYSSKIYLESMAYNVWVLRLISVNDYLSTMLSFN